MFKAICYAFLCIVVAACVPTSQSFRPDGRSGPVYRYGNFCGDGHPKVLQSIPLEQSRRRIESIESITPKDSLDRLCQWHDTCYEANGHDNPACDFALFNALQFYDGDYVQFTKSWIARDKEYLDLELSCNAQRIEIQAGMLAKAGGSRGGRSLEYAYRNLRGLASRRGGRNSVSFANSAGGDCSVSYEAMLVDCADASFVSDSWRFQTIELIRSKKRAYNRWKSYNGNRYEKARLLREYKSLAKEVKLAWPHAVSLYRKDVAVCDQQPSVNIYLTPSGRCGEKLASIRKSWVELQREEVEVFDREARNSFAHKRQYWGEYEAIADELMLGLRFAQTMHNRRFAYLSKEAVEVILSPDCSHLRAQLS